MEGLDGHSGHCEKWLEERKAGTLKETVKAAAVYYEQEVASWNGLDVLCWILGNH